MSIRTILRASHLNYAAIVSFAFLGLTSVESHAITPSTILGAALTDIPAAQPDNAPPVAANNVTAVSDYVTAVTAALAIGDPDDRRAALANAMKNLLEALAKISDPQVKLDAFLAAIANAQFSTNPQILERLKLALFTAALQDGKLLSLLIQWIAANPNLFPAKVLLKPLDIFFNAKVAPPPAISMEQLETLWAIATGTTAEAAVAQAILANYPPADPAKFWNFVVAKALKGDAFALSLLANATKLPFIGLSAAINVNSLSALFDLLRGLDTSGLTSEQRAIIALTIAQIACGPTSFVRDNLDEKTRWQAYASLTALIAELAKDKKNSALVASLLTAIAPFSDNFFKQFQALFADVTKTIELDNETLRILLSVFDFYPEYGWVVDADLLARLLAIPNLPSDIFGRIIRVLVLTDRVAIAKKAINDRILSLRELSDRKQFLDMKEYLITLLLSIQQSERVMQVPTVEAALAALYSGKPSSEWMKLINFILELAKTDQDILAALSSLRLPLMLRLALLNLAQSAKPEMQNAIITAALGILSPDLIGREDILIRYQAIVTILGLYNGAEGDEADAWLAKLNDVLDALLRLNIDDLAEEDVIDILNAILITVENALDRDDASALQNLFDHNPALLLWLQNLAQNDLGQLAAVKEKLDAVQAAINQAKEKIAPPLPEAPAPRPVAPPVDQASVGSPTAVIYGTPAAPPPSVSLAIIPPTSSPIPAASAPVAAQAPAVVAIVATPSAAFLSTVQYRPTLATNL